MQMESLESLYEKHNFAVDISADDMASIGKRIRELRIARKLTQTELARRAGMNHYQNLVRYEKGEVTPRFNKFQKIADALDVPVEYLLFGDDNGKNKAKAERRISMDTKYTPESQKLMLKLKECAALTGLPYFYWREACIYHGLPHIRSGRTIYVRRQDLLDYIEGQRIESYGGIKNGEEEHES